MEQAIRQTTLLQVHGFKCDCIACNLKLSSVQCKPSAQILDGDLLVDSALAGKAIFKDFTIKPAIEQLKVNNDFINKSSSCFDITTVAKLNYILMDSIALKASLPYKYKADHKIEDSE